MRVKNDDSEMARIDVAFAKIRHDFATGQACETEVSQLMDSLEQFAQADCDTACRLMADLWPVASALFKHDVCDAIDLWITDHRSPAVLAKLRDLAASHPDAEIRGHWQGLLNIK
jgi:hypothetical protein